MPNGDRYLNNKSTRGDNAVEKELLKRDTRQIDELFKDRLKSWLPIDHKTFLFVVIALTNLVIGVIHFVQTGDVSMVMTLLTYAAAYVGLKEASVGLKEVMSLFRKGKRGRITN